jgi:hypothetical protein
MLSTTISATLASRPPSVLLRGGPTAIGSLPRSRSCRTAPQQQQKSEQQHHCRRRTAVAASSSSSSSSRDAEALGGDLLPQNTDNPLALPNTSLTPVEAVSAQLDALGSEKLNAPWPLHGVAVSYAFCADGGSLELSRYFAPMSASLYHQDHFQGKFLTRFPGLVGHKGWAVVEVEDEGDEVVVVKASVAPSAAAGGGKEEEERHTYVFVMVRQEFGLRKGSWVTKQLVRLGKDGAPV